MIDKLIHTIWKQSKKFIKYFIQYEKTLFTTSLKDWNYINIMVACVTIVIGLFIFVGILAFCFNTGFFWTITLLISVLLYRWAKNPDAGLDDEDRMLLMAATGVFFIISLMIFLVSITT